MARRVPLSYRGALGLLGHEDPKWLGGIDAALGVAILGAGAATGVSAFLNLIDPKNEGLRLIRNGVHWVRERVSGTSGARRHDLVCAAHTILVVNAFFQSLQDFLKPWHRDLAVGYQEKLEIAGKDRDKRPPEDPIRRLIDLDIPMPWVGSGFRSNISTGIVPRLQEMMQRTQEFVAALAKGKRALKGLELSPDAVISRAVAIYADDYLRLAWDAPEFAFWALFGETSVTAEDVRKLRILIPMSEGNSRALARIETILNQLTDDVAAKVSPIRDQIQRSHRSVLRRSVLPGENIWWAPGSLRMPTVEEIYLAPRFRTCIADSGTPIASEQWWAEQEVKDDLEMFLSAHLASVRSLQQPLLILGHPGSGKSLLTAVLAASLPPTYTPLWVPLRYVDAYGAVANQVQQRLDQLTNGRVRWAELSEADGSTTRVVLLDGLDELMLASGASQSRYLPWVAEFQLTEADYDHPVAAFITSRTIVADRLAIPTGTVVVKLEDFDDDQILKWLKTWQQANAASPGFSALSMGDVERVGDFARQPLLLLMLALYVAQRETSEIGAELNSSAELYNQMITAFIGREVEKQVTKPHHDGSAGVADMRREHLGVAAFAMFNRGQQHVSEAELNNDLDVFRGRQRNRGIHVSRPDELDEPIDAAADVIGRFFFIHAPAMEWTRGNTRAQPQRVYEFLHATFAEFLIAERAVAMLDGVTTLRRRGTRRAPMALDTSELRALLGHQLLIHAPRTLTFVQEIWADHSQADREHLVDAVRELLAEDAYDEVHDASRFQRYNPSSRDELTRRAIYMINVITLRMFGSAEAVALVDLAPDGCADPEQWWRSAVAMWRATLPAADWLAVVGSFDRTSAPSSEPGPLPGVVEVRRAESREWLENHRDAFGEPRLAGDLALESWIRSGVVVWEGRSPATHAELSVHETLVAYVLNRRVVSANEFITLLESIQALPGPLPVPTTSLLARLVGRDASVLPPELVEALLNHVLETEVATDVVDDLVRVAVAFPSLLHSLPRLVEVIGQGEPAALTVAMRVLSEQHWPADSPNEVALRQLRLELMRAQHPQLRSASVSRRRMELDPDRLYAHYVDSAYGQLTGGPAPESSRRRDRRD